jgi:CDP-diacylglycerol---serine O-phosphatidyltransferase
VEINNEANSELGSFEDFESRAETAGPRVLRPRNRHLRRGVYLLPTLFTVGNLLCGYYAILATLEGRIGDLDHAARAIGYAILFDALDGRVARLTGTNSEFGKQFDSLADIVSFGIAPAFLTYAWGVRDLPSLAMGQSLHIYQAGWLFCFIFVACCAWRLARFNIQGMAPAGGGSRYFVGLPCPAAAGMVAAMVHASYGPVPGVVFAILSLFLVLALGILMSSTVRYYSFKDIRWQQRRASGPVIVLGAMALGAVVFYSRLTLVLMGGLYVIHGPVLELIRILRRHRHSARPA